MRSISKRLIELGQSTPRDVDHMILISISQTADSSNDADYINYEDHLYSPVSHITFIHKPR